MKKENRKKPERNPAEPLKPGQKAGTPETMALTYDCSAGTLANHRSRGTGAKFYRQGHRIYYKVDDFERWLFSNPVMTKDAHQVRE